MPKKVFQIKIKPLKPEKRKNKVKKEKTKKREEKTKKENNKIFTL